MAPPRSLQQRKPINLWFAWRIDESTRRKKKARKTGGDPRKKRKAKRKSKRSKKSTKVVFLVSTAKTGFSYSKRKSVESRDKLKLWKYDPVVNRHVPFQE